MSQELEKILEGLKNFDHVIAKKVSVKKAVIKFVLGEVAEVQKIYESNYFITVIKGKKFYSFSLSGTEDLNRVIKSVEDGFSYTVESDIVPFITENDSEIKVKEDNIELERMIQDLDIAHIDSSLSKSEFPSSGIVNVYEVKTNLLTSKGFRGEEVRIRTDGYVRSFNNEYSGQWAFYSDSLKEFDNALKRANELASITGKVRVDDGKYDVVLSPLVVANFMSYFADFASAFSVLTGSSFFAKFKKGEKVGSDILTISEIPRKARVAEFDDEATFTMDKDIIREGVFSSLLYNNELAELFKERSTGNAGLVYPIAYAFEVKPGDNTVGSLLASSENVLFINNNWYTRFQNYYEGTFSTVGRDAVVVYREGKPVGVAGRVRVSDSFPNMLKSVKAIGREEYSVKWWDAPIPTLSPYLYLEKINISKAW